ncbi:LysM peptidoglycan-binding domain-containing protein [Fontimonas sp. SYSU GA230001]
MAILAALDAQAQNTADEATPQLISVPDPQAAELSSVPFPTLPGGAQAMRDDLLFPRYERLAPAVKFWSRVFSEYSELQSVVHSTEYPHKVLRVLDFRGQATVMSEIQLANYRKKAEQDARDEFEKLIRAVHAKRAAPQQMSAEERRIFDLYADVAGDDKFLRMRDTVRTQRGIKERTEKALRVSDGYLPYMERIFSNYGLPQQLTRLPIVESSFNLDAYSKSGAAGVWQFIPSSARIYMRLDEIVDDRRDPWTSTDAAARHLRDDYQMLGDWPLALTAYNHGRNGIARGLKATNGKNLIDLIDRYDNPRFGFAGKNYYAEFLAALDVERKWRERENRDGHDPIEFEIVETRHYVPYETLRRLCGARDEDFRRLNPAYRPEVIDGRLYVPPGHLIRVPAGSARAFDLAYAKLGAHERFDRQRVFYLLHKVDKGQTLGGIAKQYRVSIDAIRRANGIRGSALRVGQVLKIPPREETRPGPISVAVGESTPSLTRTQAAAAQREADGSTHVVGQGDTLAAIARRYGVSVAELSRVNRLESSEKIRVGQQLTIPQRGTPARSGYRQHTVSKGQTLESIARRYGVSVADLRSANDLDGSTLIKVGQTLRVPRDG